MVILEQAILKIMVNKTALALTKLTFSLDYCTSKVKSNVICLLDARSSLN